MKTGKTKQERRVTPPSAVVYGVIVPERRHGACTQCEALMINGVYCHETGCPVERRERRDADQADREDAGSEGE